MKIVLLCLHGWGGSKESFTELRAALKGTNIEILTPDLPGFGDEPDPPKPWTVDDYAKWVEDWLKPKIHDSTFMIHVVGHSHGGRIAIKLALRANIRVSRLYLCASAGIRHPRHIKRIIGLTLAKGGKALLSIPGMKALQPLGKRFLYRLVRVHDYEKASPILRETLIKVTEEDFREQLPSIHLPTAIFWGEDDRMTPVGDAYVMHRLIAGSTLQVFPGIRHAVHRAKATEIAEAIKQDLANSSNK